MGSDELSTTGNCCSTLVTSMFFKVTILAAFGGEKRLLEGSIRTVAYSGFGVGCWDPFKGLQEVSVLEINAQTLSPHVKEFFSPAY